MSDSALEYAMKRRDDLAAKINMAQQQIEGWRRDLAKADAFVRDWHLYAGTEPPPGLTGVSVAVAVTKAESEATAGEIAAETTKRAVLHNSKKEDVAAETRRIIEERGQPILRKDLLPLLIERGHKIEGTDPDMVLSTMLWRAGKAAGVVRLKRGGYWRSDMPSPDGLWDPRFGPAYRGEPQLEALAAGGYGAEELFEDRLNRDDADDERQSDA